MTHEPDRILAATQASQERRDVDLFDCAGKDVPIDGHVPFDLNNHFLPNCAPEVLYTWKDRKAFKESVASQLKGRGPVASNPTHLIYAVRTPLASHAYGEVSFRLKLKKDVRFVFANYESDCKPDIEDAGPRGPLAECYPIRECPYYKKKYGKDIDRIVIASVLPGYNDFSEYILCSDGPIESWSFGTAPHLKEMEKEYSLFNAGKPVETLVNDLTSEADLTHADEDEKLRQCPDGMPCSKKDLLRRMNTHRKMVELGEGKIFYLGKSKSPLEHFWTEKRFYFSLEDRDLEALSPRK